MVVGVTLALAPIALAREDSGAATVQPTSGQTPVSATIASVEPSTDALAAIETTAHFAISIVDIDSGASLTYGSEVFDTASIVKVDILAALLWQHGQQGIALNEEERQLASAMITVSDNAAATRLFTAVGGEAGLEAFNTVIGLTETDVGSDGNWGLTQTTAADQTRLLAAVLGDKSVLSASARAYVQELMSSVIDSQNFGVSAAADDPAAAELKVGYLQRSTTGLWDVTSIGRIESAGHAYFVAVLSDENASFEAGTSLVDVVAQTGVAAMQ